MPTIKSTAKTANRSDRIVFAERRNRLEKMRNEFQMKLLEREKSRVRFTIGKERKEIAKRFQTVQQTTGVSSVGLPSSLHDKDVCSSDHYRCGQVISARRLKQWRRQEDLLQHQVKFHEAKDEEEITDRHIVLNNLLAELRHENKDCDDDMRQRPNRPMKELRMPYSAHPSTLDVFQCLRSDVPELDDDLPVRPTAYVSRIRHYDHIIEPEIVPQDKSKPKSMFDIPRWEKEIKKYYMSRLLDSETVSDFVDRTSARPASAPMRMFHSSGTPTGTGNTGTTGRSESPLFIRVNKALPHDRGILKVRPHSASVHSKAPKIAKKESPKSSPHGGRTVLRNPSSTIVLTDMEGLAPPPAQERSGGLTPPPQNCQEKSPPSPSSGRSGVSFAMKATVYNIDTDDESPVEEAVGERRSEEDEKDVVATDEVTAYQTDESDEDIQHINDVSAENHRQQAQSPVEQPSEKDEGDTSSKRPVSAIRKVSFNDPHKPMDRSQSRGQIDSRDRKISPGSSGGGPRESLDMLRNKQLLINIDSRGIINKRLTGSRESLSAKSDEEAKPTGPPQWRRDLLRDAPPAMHSPAEVPRVYMTMSRSARRKELEKMVEQNTSNLRDMILSEKERRAQTRVNIQKYMAELDTINAPT